MRHSVKRALFSPVSKKERFFEYKNDSVTRSLTSLLRNKFASPRNFKRTQGLLRRGSCTEMFVSMDDFPNKIDLFLA
jgi:hypothetical protein